MMVIIKLAALFNFLFALLHLFFWRLLHWKEELKRFSPVNAAVMQTLNVCLTFMFLLVSFIYYFYTDEVRTTGIGSALLLGMGLFWLIRTVAQIVFFNMQERVHQILLALFIVGCVVHLLPFV